ncbi:MAG TPA: hypothetical protein DCP07_03045 [Lachnospiraceae bacterium]|nr:hypothetical protein [Lachnospiraceae bacterium]
MKNHYFILRGALALFMSFVLTCGLLLHDEIIVNAGDNITSEDYQTEPGTGDVIYHADQSGASYDNITVPSGCIFEVTAPITVTGDITVEDGGSVFIFSNPDSSTEGSISGGTWLPENGASLMIGTTLADDDVSLASPVTLYDGNTMTTFDSGYHWAEFIYDSSESKWLCYTPTVPDNVGSNQIDSAASSYIYAYALDGTSDDAIKTSLAKELYGKFIRVESYGSFGIPVADMENNPSSQQIADYNDGINELVSRIDNLNSDGTITAINAAGSGVSISYKTYRVNWGLDQDDPDTEIYSDLRVYYGISNDGLLINTNYSKNTTSNWYIRSLNSDLIPFTNAGSNGFLVTSSTIGNVVVGGNACLYNTLNTNGLCELELSIRNSYTNTANTNAYNGIVRILKNADTYVSVEGTGEPNAYDNLGENHYKMDNIWETGNNAEAYAYIGCDSITIRSLTVADSKNITNVSLADSSLTDNVTIDTSGLSNASPYFELSFTSNYYDSIPLNITFEGGITRKLTIKRIGLVFGYNYLMDGNTTGYIDTDCNNGHKSFSYDYDNGEQIVVYATYYHPTNYVTSSGGNDLYLNVQYANGTSEIKHHTDTTHNFNGYQSAGSGGVATTSFILGFLPAHTSNGNMINNQYLSTGGLYGTVINAGFDDEDTFGGTQIGSGQGVYWNSKVSWFSNN